MPIEKEVNSFGQFNLIQLLKITSDNNVCIAYVNNGIGVNSLMNYFLFYYYQPIHTNRHKLAERTALRCKFMCTNTLFYF